MKHGVSWLQDLLIAYSSDTADAASKARTKEQMRKVSTDVEAFRQVMERVLAQLAGFDEDGAPALTTKALEAVDLVNNALDMQAEVWPHVVVVVVVVCCFFCCSHHLPTAWR